MKKVRLKPGDYCLNGTMGTPPEYENFDLLIKKVDGVWYTTWVIEDNRILTNTSLYGNFKPLCTSFRKRSSEERG